MADLSRNVRVAVIYKSLPSYRVEFFEELRRLLTSRGFQFELFYGDGDTAERLRNDLNRLAWGRFRPNWILKIGGRSAIWQPVLKEIWGFDLVIVEQANRLLINLPLLVAGRLRIGPRVAFWGHGANLQASNSRSLSEQVKKRLVRWPSWWFSYTDSVTARLVSAGYPATQITTVYNSIDTQNLTRQIDAIPGEAVYEFCLRYGLTIGRTAIFIGSLYGLKRLDFLLDCCTRIRREVPDFSIVICGDGPDRDLVSRRADSDAGVVFLGRVDGIDRAMALRCASLTLMPGLVGLAILDALAAGAPMVTTDQNYHSPEIDYLRDGFNGSLLPWDSSVRDYSEEVIRLLRDDRVLADMQHNCRMDSAMYSTQSMAENFAGGVEASAR